MLAAGAVKRRAVLIALGALAVGLLAVFGLAGKHSSKAPARAPELPREVLHGARPSISGLLASARGRDAVVVFWASWCGPCGREAPAIERFAASREGHGRIVGVDWSDERSEALKFIRGQGWSFPNVRDGGGEVGLAYHLTVLPTTFLLGHGGRIVATLRGPQTQRTLQRALAGAERA